MCDFGSTRLQVSESVFCDYQGELNCLAKRIRRGRLCSCWAILILKRIHISRVEGGFRFEIWVELSEDEAVIVVYDVAVCCCFYFR